MFDKMFWQANIYQPRNYVIICNSFTTVKIYICCFFNSNMLCTFFPLMPGLAWPGLSIIQSCSSYISPWASSVIFQPFPERTKLINTCLFGQEQAYLWQIIQHCITSNKQSELHSVALLLLYTIIKICLTQSNSTVLLPPEYYIIIITSSVQQD